MTKMKNLKDIKVIERYLEGEMSEEEMADLEVRCLFDPEFHKEFQTMEVLVAGIKESAEESTLEDKVSRLKTKATTKEKGRRVISIDLTYRTFWLGVAASIAVLIAFWVGWSSRPISPGQTLDQLYATAFVVSPNVGLRQSRSATNEALPTYSAYRAYDRRDFTEAAAIFEQFTDDDNPYLNTDLFHLGNCYLVLEEWDKAVTTFEAVIAQEGQHTENGRWYLALSYLKTGKTKRAKALLDEITLPIKRANQAKEISEQLQLLD
jgi:tetratricopeptide (TPR) repeat protein